MSEHIFLTIDDLATGRSYPLVVREFVKGETPDDNGRDLLLGWCWRIRPEPKGGAIEHAWTVLTDDYSRAGRIVQPVAVEIVK